MSPTQINSVVMINCGGYLNLLELVQPDNREAKFYVIDSHRPLELDNVYNQDQIIIVVREEDKLNVPEYDAIYSSDKVSWGNYNLGREGGKSVCKKTARVGLRCSNLDKLLNM